MTTNAEPAIVSYGKWADLKDAVIQAILRHGLKVEVFADKAELHIYSVSPLHWIWTETRRVDPSHISYVYDRIGLEEHGEDAEVLERRLLPAFQGEMIELCWTRPMFPGEPVLPHKDRSFPLLESPGAGALSPSLPSELAALEARVKALKARMKKEKRHVRPVFYNPDGTPSEATREG